MTNLFQASSVDTPLLEDSITPWMGPLAPWTREVHVDNDERARNWFAICCALSLLLHLAALMLYLPKQLGQQPASASLPRVPISATLKLVPQHAEPTPDTKDVHAAPRREPSKKTVVTSRKPASPDRSSAPPVTPPPIAKPVLPQADEDDFSTRLAKRRAARGEADPLPSSDDAGGSPNRAADDVIAKNIQRSLDMNSKTHGTGGVFQVLSMGVREATLRFNGWHPGSDNHWRETYTVDAGEGGDVRKAVVRKEIEIIRKFYTGDFDWISSRNGGRAIKMSARPADNDQLERFLMQEMWSDDDGRGARRG